jgi:hypothetical protein
VGFYLILWIIATVLWPPVVAYRRMAIHRRRILITSLAMPVGAYAYFMADFTIVGKLGAPESLWIALTMIIGIAYLVSGVGLIIWSYRSPSTVEQRGFPIEPINSVASNDSDPV